MGVRDVGIDLRGGDVGMAEHGLNSAKIGAVHEKVGGEGMTQSVRADVLSDAGHAGVFFDDTLDAAWGEAAEIARGVDGLLVFTIV